MSAMARPSPASREAGADSHKDDPLVELARLVAGRANHAASGKNAHRDETDLTVDELARGLEADLEAELYADLQSSFSDAVEAELRSDQPTMNRRAAAQASGGTKTARARAEPLDSHAEAGSDLPPLPRSRPAPDFSSFNLRNEKGPAYNPNALSADRYREDRAPRREQEHYSDAFDEEPLLDPERETPAPRAEPLESYDDGDDWDFDPHPHVAEAAAGTAEPAYLDHAEAYSRDDAPAVRPSRSTARHRDPRLDRDPLGEARYRRAGGRRLVPLIGVVLIIALGAAGVMVLRNGGGTTEPVLVSADPSPTRVFPEPEPANPENLVFNRINPEAPAPAENLLPPAEPPADLGAAPQANDGITQILTPADPAAAVDPGIAADLPRMVRTVTVLPDGTIVENETAPAGGAAPTPAPAATPPAPAAAAATPPAPEPAAPADPIAAVVDAAAAEPPAPLFTPPAAEAEPLVLAPAPPPAAAPGNLPRVGDPIAPGFYVQVSSQRSEQAAQTQLAALRSQAPSVLGDKPAIIQQVELDERGVFFRVQFGPFTGAEAQSILQSLGQVGIDAFVMNH